MTPGRQAGHRGIEVRRLGSTLFTFALLALAPAGSAFAQVTDSPLAPAREAYEAAIDVWVALQQNLAEELRLLPAEAARIKLQGTEKARQAVARARLSYLSSLSRSYADVAASLRGAAGGTADSTTGLILSADKSMLSDLDAAVVLLDGEIKSAAATDRPRSAALQKQKTDLLELKSLIQRRGRELDRLDSARTIANGRWESLAKAYARLAEWASTAAEAAAQGKPLADHFSHLVVHGMLHLLGFDHTSAALAEEMEGLEIRVLKGLGVADPYAEGAEGQ